MKIGVNYMAMQRDKRNAEKKKELLSKAVQFFEQRHLPVDVRLLHREGFVNYFFRLYAETYAANFPSYTTAPERVAMAQINLVPLNELWEQYNLLRTPFDIETQDVPEGVCYDIILDQQQAEYYTSLENIVKAIDDFHMNNYEGFNVPQLISVKNLVERRMNQFKMQ